MTFTTVSLLFVLGAIALEDVRKGIIPDFWLAFLALLGFLQFKFTYIISVLILGGIGYGLYKSYPLLKGRQGLGFGDVKMMAIAGLWLPLTSLPLFLTIVGGCGILIALLWRLSYKSFQFPLGPALALALGLCTLRNDVFSKGEITMTHVFSGPTLSPAAGDKPESLVVFIHGYGANGEDLLPLGKAWSSILPNTLFVAPHGPVMCETNPSGKQWFGLQGWDPARILKEIQSITPAFNRYLDGLLKQYDLPPEKLALVGFSQGAMLSLHVALLRPQCGGVVAYSGAFLEDPTEFKIARPPILLVHGTEDQVISAFFSESAELRLKTIGVPVSLSLLPNLDHEIDERALGLGGAFLKQHLYDAT